MIVTRFLNGKRLHTALPPLVLDNENIGWLLWESRKQLPLPADGRSVILNIVNGEEQP